MGVCAYVMACFLYVQQMDESYSYFIKCVCLYLISKLHPMDMPCIRCDCVNALELYFAKYGHKHSMMLMRHSRNKTTKLDSGKKEENRRCIYERVHATHNGVAWFGLPFFMALLSSLFNSFVMRQCLDTQWTMGLRV